MAAGPRLQRINAALHVEPLASMAYCLFWLLFLLGVVPAVAILALTVLAVYRFLAWKFDWNGANEYDPPKHPDIELAVVITGCDTGFGREMALWSAEAGFVVFAGCLKEESCESFDVKKAGNRIFPLIMDVTRDEDVAKAVSRVSEWIESQGGGDVGKKKKRLLHSLVNNAGIERSGFFDWLEVSDYRKVMEVNYFGVLRCCKAFMPLLKNQAISGSHRGSRIINMTSIAGVVPGNPIGSAYVASKHAAQVFTEALRKELAVFGIGVMSVNPSFHNTSMFDEVKNGSSIRRTWDRMAPDLREEYGEGVLNAIIDFGKKFTSVCWDLDVVVDQVLQNLKLRDIPGQVLVGTDARYFIPLMRMLPGWFLALNQKDENLVPAALRKKRT